MINRVDRRVTELITEIDSSRATVNSKMKCLEEELKRLTKRFQITFSRVLSIISSSKLSTFPKRCRVCEQLVLLNPNGWISVALQLKTLFTMTNLLESIGQKTTDVKAFKSKVHSLVLLPHKSTAEQKAWH